MNRDERKSTLADVVPEWKKQKNTGTCSLCQGNTGRPI